VTRASAATAAAVEEPGLARQGLPVPDHADDVAVAALQPSAGDHDDLAGFDLGQCDFLAKERRDVVDEAAHEFGQGFAGM
jgi:hypothetical protein